MVALTFGKLLAALLEVHALDRHEAAADGHGVALGGREGAQEVEQLRQSEVVAVEDEREGQAVHAVGAGRRRRGAAWRVPRRARASRSCRSEDDEPDASSPSSRRLGAVGALAPAWCVAAAAAEPPPTVSERKSMPALRAAVSIWKTSDAASSSSGHGLAELGDGGVVAGRSSCGAPSPWRGPRWQRCSWVWASAARRSRRPPPRAWASARGTRSPAMATTQASTPTTMRSRFVMSGARGRRGGGRGRARRAAR